MLKNRVQLLLYQALLLKTYHNKLKDNNGDYIGDYADMYDGICNRFNLELDLGVRAEFFRHFGLNANYNIGLLNILKDGDSDNSHRASHFNIGIFYMF